MPSTYSDLKIELIAVGEQSGTWGTTTNTNLGTAIQEAITGSADVAFSSADVTISLTNTNSTQAARNLRLNLTGTSAGARNLTVPAIEKLYLINNGLADTCTIKNATGTGIAVPAGKTMFVFNNGTNVVETTSHINALTLTTDLAVADGGTGASSASDARTNLGLGTMAVQDAVSISVSGGSATTLTNLTTASFAATGTATSSGTLAITGNLTLDGASGTAGQFLTSAGSGVTPTWGGVSLGTMASQDSDNVTITGGSITGLTSLSTSGGTISATTLTATATLGVGAGWTAVQDVSNNLIFKYSGVSKMKLDSSGNLTVVGDITAFGTI